MRAVVPQAGLREAILTGARTSRGGKRADSGASAGRTGAPTARRAWWAHPVWLAAAAALAVLLRVAASRLAPVRGEAFEEFAVDFVTKGFRLQKRGAEVATLKTWLGEQHGPLPQALPTPFVELRALGCRMLSFKGRTFRCGASSAAEKRFRSSGRGARASMRRERIALRAFSPGKRMAPWPRGGGCDEPLRARERCEAERG